MFVDNNYKLLLDLDLV